MKPAVRSEHLLREVAPQVLGAVIRRFRDFAALQWPREGVPENPRAWLIQVASQRNDRPRAQ